MFASRNSFGSGGHARRGGSSPLFSAIMILFWVAVIFGLVVLISKYVNHTATKNQLPTEAPIDIAKARYARGEITKDEFEQLKKDLS